ncbi:MAG: hypothetical protein CMO61_14120 [Verrucomicrobiales bacterium]|nr:hypothetical protein [Verrucomicrobiales bacterium]
MGGFGSLHFYPVRRKGSPATHPSLKVGLFLRTSGQNILAASAHSAALGKSPLLCPYRDRPMEVKNSNHSHKEIKIPKS